MVLDRAAAWTHSLLPSRFHFWENNVREYGLVTGLVATTINFLCDIFRDNLWGGDRVKNTLVFGQQCWIWVSGLLQVWGSTKLRGEVLDYLGQLVLQVSKKLHPIFAIFPLNRAYPICLICLHSVLSEQGAIDPVGERIYSLEQSEIAFRELAAGGHKVMHQLCNTQYAITNMQYPICKNKNAIPICNNKNAKPKM